MEDYTIADWVPRTVQSLAMQMQISGEPFGWLLTTDQGKRVWTELARRSPVSVDDPDGTLAKFNLTSEFGFTGAELAAALFFYAILRMVGSSQFVVTQQQSEDWSKYYGETAKRLQVMQYDQMATAAEKQAMAAIASYCIAQSERVSFEAEPRKIHGSSGSEERNRLRASVRELAATTYKIYGRLFYGTLRNVATITLQPSQPLTRDDIINWCDELVREKRIIKQPSGTGKV